MRHKKLIPVVLASLFLVVSTLVPLTVFKAEATPQSVGVSTLSVNTTAIQLPGGPSGMVYDPANGFLYVADYQSEGVSVINTTTNTLVTTIHTGLNAWMFALDSLNGLIYVANDFSNQLTVLNPVTETVVGNISLGNSNSAVGVVFDPYNGMIYAMGDQTGTIVVINATYNIVQQTINMGSSVGTGNQGIAITPWNDFLYIANYYTNTLTVLNGSTNSIVGTIVVGNQPVGSIYDPVNNMVYVPLRGYNASYGDTVVVVNPKLGKAVGDIVNFYGPNGNAFDPTDSVLAVADTGSNHIGLINASTSAFIGNVTVAPAGQVVPYVFYLPQKNLFYVTLTYSNKLVYFSLSGNQQTSIPGNSLNLVIDNSQNTATPNPYQQMIVFESSLFRQVENPSLSNVEFMYTNGTVIPSWIESGASSASLKTVYWLKMNGIAANSSVDIQMFFAPKSTNFFSNTGLQGEAPQLSPNYGEYDNGALIFNYYVNFAGTALPSSMIYAYNDSYGASNYITIHNGLTISTADISSVGFGVHVNQTFGPYTTTDIAGVPMYPNAAAYSSGFFGYDVANGVNTLLIGNPSGYTTATFPYQSSNPSMLYQQGIWTVSRYGSNAWGMFNYTAGPVANNEPTGNFILGDHGQGNANPSFVQWWRVRSTPPNGEMPAVYLNLNNQTSLLPGLGNQNQKPSPTSTSPTGPQTGLQTSFFGSGTGQIVIGGVIAAAALGAVLAIDRQRSRKKL